MVSFSIVNKWHVLKIVLIPNVEYEKKFLSSSLKDNLIFYLNSFRAKPKQRITKLTNSYFFSAIYSPKAIERLLVPGLFIALSLKGRQVIFCAKYMISGFCTRLLAFLFQEAFNPT